MNILMGIDNAQDIKVLCKVGVKEFFCGYVTEKWINTYNKNTFIEKEIVQMQVSPNKRDWIKQNVTSYNRLVHLCDVVHKFGAKIYVTFNHPFYPEQVYNDLVVLVEDVISAGIDGVIITDVGFVSFIHSNYPNLKIILSTCQSVFNSNAVDFFKELGVKRITFPRHVSLKEVCNIVSKFPDMEFECFLVEGKCIYDDGSCRPLHSAGVFCMDQWEYSYHKDSHQDFEYSELNELICNAQVFDLRNRLFGGRQNTVNNWSYIGCGICAIPQILKNTNIVTLKIAGRGYSIEEKYSLAKYVNSAIQKAVAGADLENMKNMGKERLGMPELCDLHKRCYLPLD